jgi:5-oxoprolinase (ATP-hydrolysing)
MHKVYFEQAKGRIDTPVFELGKLEVGDVVNGPAMIIDDTQTIVLDPESEAVITSKHLYITLS